MKRIDQDASSVNTASKKIAADKRTLLKRLGELRQQGRLRAVKFAPPNVRDELESELAALERLDKIIRDARSGYTNKVAVHAGRWLDDLNEVIGHKRYKLEDNKLFDGSKETRVSYDELPKEHRNRRWRRLQNLNGKHYEQTAVELLERFIDDDDRDGDVELELKPALVEAVGHNDIIAWFVDVKDAAEFVARIAHKWSYCEVTDAMPFSITYGTAKQNAVVKDRDADIAKTHAKFEVADAGSSDVYNVYGDLESKGRENERDKLLDRLVRLYQLKQNAAPYRGLLDAATFEPTEVLPVLPKDGTAATTSDWLQRPIAPLDALLGDAVFSTTGKTMLVGVKGIGKTTLAIAIGMRASLGLPFLHWTQGRPCNVLLVDADMGRRQLKDRIVAEAKRIGQTSNTFFALSHEDLTVAPLHLDASEEARKAIEDFIEERMGGKVDLIIFDNLASLVEGDLVSGAAWKAMMPWVRNLTERCVGQVWIHHAGHNTKRFYGSDTTSWHIDAVMHLNHVEREGIDVSFELNFDEKARDRTPDNRDQFARAKVALVNDAWQVEGVAIAMPKKRMQLTPMEKKFFDVLGATGDVVTIEAWVKALIAANLLNAASAAGDGKITNSSRKLLSRHRKALVAKGWITEDEDSYVAVCTDEGY